jgi:aryl-alcohol dehydrogenase-like predicted oxidoreductase
LPLGTSKLQKLRKTELQVSDICFGGNVFGWTADQLDSFRLLDGFIEHGGNFIDTADVYSSWKPGNSGGESETIIGNYLKLKGNRDQVVVATKVAMLETRKGLSKSNIIAACNDSLARLQTDYIDIYYAHSDDTETDLTETLEGFNSLVEQGKVRYIAASNYTFDRLNQALNISNENNLASYVALQNRYSLVAREPYESDGAKSVEEFKISGLPYSTLGSGFLSGKYRAGETVDSQRAEGVKNNYLNAENIELLKRLEQVANEYQVSNTAVALAWLRRQPGVTVPLASARTLAQLEELMQKVELTTQEISFIAGE